MPRLHVCSLARIDEVVETTGARSMVTLLSPGTLVVRPSAITLERHLHIAMSDIVEHTPGHVLPDVAHVDALIAFVRGWDRKEPMLIHCFAGVSRSTATAYIAACLLAPHRDEHEVARALRAASPTATPDAALGRSGRMSLAIASIGRGAECSEGVPFAFEIG
jgi:predicted protein tyrosine phosphatase